jgi:dTDP-4-dehydrorhamnose 3,5-epimerase
MSATFTIQELALPGVLRIVPTRFDDERGFAAVPYSKDDFSMFGVAVEFVHDFTSFSQKGVIRGLHFQREPHMQDKLVRCSSGEIIDVVADYQPESATYGAHLCETLSGKTQTMLYIPGRYAHGFCVTSNGAVTEYKMSAAHAPEYAGGVRWNDPLLAIDWPVIDPILSDRDKEWSLLPAHINHV